MSDVAIVALVAMFFLVVLLLVGGASLVLVFLPRKRHALGWGSGFLPTGFALCLETVSAPAKKAPAPVKEAQTSVPVPAPVEVKEVQTQVPAPHPARVALDAALAILQEKRQACGDSEIAITRGPEEGRATRRAAYEVSQREYGTALTAAEGALVAAAPHLSWAEVHHVARENGIRVPQPPAPVLTGNLNFVPAPVPAPAQAPAPAPTPTTTN